MNEEEPPESPVPGTEPVEEEEEDEEEDVEQSVETKSSEAENTPEAAPAQEPLVLLDGFDTNENLSPDPMQENFDEDNEDSKANSGEPPIDWFEPLEDDDDDDANSIGRNDPEEESLAGESERSESMAGSEKAFRKIYQLQVPRRKRSHPDEGWVEWPMLGEGWKRKEVVRRSGSSIGQKDVYYLRLHSDTTGRYGELQNCLIVRQCRKVRERSSSESSWMERGEGADTPDSYHRLTPNLTPKNPHFNQTGFSSHNAMMTANHGSRSEDPEDEDKIRLPLPSSSSKPLPLPSINGEIGSEDSTLVCAKCGISFTGTWYDKQRKRPCCPSCWAASKTKEHPMIRFRKHPSLKSSDTENFSVNVDVDDEDEMSTDDDDDWHKKRKRRSCGECKACLCRKDCGTCDFCIDKPKFGGSNKKRQKCRLRQCQRQAMRHLLPFQMGQGDYGPDGQMLPGRPRPHYTYSRKSNFKKNKGPQSALDFTDNEDDDSNFQAQLNHLDYVQRNGLTDRVPNLINHNSELGHLSGWDAEKSHTGRDGQMHLDEDDEQDEEEEEELPMITQIFSLADNPAASGVDIENQLMKLLQSLRLSVLPILWYAIIVEGPQLQLIQCSKQSNMTDTMVLIDPGFCYQVTVQKQPLLPTHPLYDKYPGRLSSVTEVVNLLLGLEKYVVCQGLHPREPLSSKDPLIVKRASTCDFLVKRKVSICTNCRALQGL
ncbi:Methyl-CpG-binding domain protein 1 [Nibea albiflora]|uniref:Methyl-CpG-binding domain protein 1 n=1 Tax=Nibea albiflora TaxID=240163 RepID=A0ACB7EYU0_NIBAL|nr:Methyl-CpG-binding domain protein 1 [Nibea albiflora]